MKELAPYGGMIYLIMAYLQAIIFVRLMKEKDSAGFIIFLATLFAPVVTFALFAQGVIIITKYLLNVGREEKIDL